MAVVDRDRAHLDAMIAGIAHDLRRRVETHRLGVEQSGTEYVGMMMLHPARGIGDLRKARCMALRKAIAPEALDLLEGALGKILGITPFDHAADELVVEMRSEEHTSELQSLMRISYAVFCLTKKKKQYNQ